MQRKISRRQNTVRTEMTSGQGRRTPGLVYALFNHQDSDDLLRQVNENFVAIILS